MSSNGKHRARRKIASPGMPKLGDLFGRDGALRLLGVPIATVAAIVVGAFATHDPIRPAAARDTTPSTVSPACGSYKNSGRDQVFQDGSTLFGNMNMVRCTLKVDFEVLTLAKSESLACVNAIGRITSIIRGDEVSVDDCSPNQLVFTAAMNLELYKLSPEVRWFALAAVASKMIFDGTNNHEAAICVGGYTVAAQSKLDREKLVEELRAMAPDDTAGLEALLAGISLYINSKRTVNDRAYLWCVSNPQQWHNPKAEVVTPVSK